MANIATSTYKVTGSHKVVSDLWTAFQSMNVNTQNIWLDELAKYYGIDYETKHISVRGHIYFAEYEEDNGRALLSFETETAWDEIGMFLFHPKSEQDVNPNVAYLNN